MGRAGQLRAGSKAGRLVAALLESLEERTVSSGLTPQDSGDGFKGCLKQAVLVLDQILAVLDDPLGGCIRTDTVMAEEVPEELDGSKTTTLSALCPIGVW